MAGSTRTTTDSTRTEDVQKLVSWYLSNCKEYQVVPSADVLTFLKLGGSSLTLNRYHNRKDGWRSPCFGDLDLQPLAVLLEAEASLLGRLQVLDVSGARGLGPSGAVQLAQLIGSPRASKLVSLNLSGQRPGVEGVAALVDAVRRSKSLRSLEMRSCHFGDAGGELFAALLQEGQEVHGLEHLDLENNFISFHTCQCLQQASRGQKLQLQLVGNQVLDEVLNAVSHGLGLLLAIVGSVFLGIAASEKPYHCKVAVALYCIALNVLYIASTLFHSFYALGPTVVWVFGVLDHCAIYLLIAGSYCPFLSVFFPGALSEQKLLVSLWVMAFSGMITTAFYRGPQKKWIELSLYLGMGWSCAGCLGEMMARMGPEGSRLLVAGGLFYTGGVPFFVKGKRTLGVPDHTIWHIFVLAGSMSHYFCVLWYCVPLAGKFNVQLQ